MATEPALGRLVRLHERIPREFIGFVIGGTIAAVLGVYLHELTHQYVFARYGCGSTIQLFPLHRGAVATTSPAPDCLGSLTAAQRRDLHLIHQMVESVGYQVIPLYGLIGSVGGYLLARG